MVDKQKDNDFIAYVMSSVTFWYGVNIIFSEGYLIERFSIWVITPTIENGIGVAFVAAALLKLMGLLTNNKYLKKVGIVLMTVLWAGIISFYVFEAFKLQFLGLILTHPILVLCLRIARRGDYIE